MLGGDVVEVYIARELPTVVELVLTFFLVRRHIPGWRPDPRRFSRATFKLVFTLSALSLLTQFAALLAYQTDRIILGAFLPAAGALTVYTIIAKPFELVRMFSGLFNSAVMPAVSAAEASEGRSAVERFVYDGSRLSNAFVAVVAITASFVAIPFIRLWVGEEYVADAWIAPVLCAFQLVWQSTSMLGRVYYGTGQATRPALLAITTAVCNVALSVALVQVLGVQGVLLATVIAGIVSVPIEMLWIFPHAGIARGRFLLHSVVASQWPMWIMALALAPFFDHFLAIASWPSLIAHALALGALGAGLAYTLVLRPGERAILRAIVDRRVRRRAVPRPATTTNVPSSIGEDG
jgi:O-antigen/teichoic acid export membrane protein